MIGSLMYLTSSRPDIMFADRVSDVLLVQVYVDDIIFGSTRKELCTECEKIMHKNFKMSYMGELTFFLGLQVKQKEDGIFISQDNELYTPNVWNRMEKLLRMKMKQVVITFSTVASAIICLATNQKFNFYKYIFESMVNHLDTGNKFLMYPRFVQVFLDKQVEGMSKHNAIYVIPSHTKKVFRNMKRVGKDFSRRVTPLFSTTMVQAQEDIGEGSSIPTDPHHTPTLTQPSTSQPLRKQNLMKTKRKDTELPHTSVPTEHVADEAVNEEMEDSLVRATTTATGLDAEQDRGNIFKTQSYATPNESISQETSSGCGPRCQETMRGTIAQTSLGEEDASKQGRNIVDIDADAETTLVNETVEDQGRYNDEEMFDTSVLDNEEVKKAVADKEIDAAQDQVSFATTTTAKDLTIALEALKTLKPKIIGIVIKDHEEPSKSKTKTLTSVADSTRLKAKGIVMQEPSEAKTTIILIPSQVKDKRKGKIHLGLYALKKKAQISLDEELTFKLQAEQEEEEERIAREKAFEANIAVIEQWHDVQAKIEADFKLAQRLHQEEQEQFTNDEKAKLFMEFLEKRRKLFAAKRAKDKRNRPPTKAQQRSLMWINNFVDFGTELVEESSKKAEECSSKRARDELEQESAKKHKVDDDQEAPELKKCLEIFPNDEDDVTIDATPLSSMSPTIIYYKIHKEWRKSYFQIIREDGSSQMHYTFSKMLKNFNREDLEVL
nr:putative ribonuclease H-like domain-containing protein [Tanacetum cinerariifolium]